jgi:protein-tyrosine phosphatase
MAAAMLQEGLGARFRVVSAGLGARDGFPAHPQAARLMAARALDLSGHASRQLTPELALGADLILVMDRAQKELCEHMLPSVKGRVFLLGQWRRPVPLEVPDPYQRGPEVFREVLDAIDLCVADWIPRLAAR